MYRPGGGGLMQLLFSLDTVRSYHLSSDWARLFKDIRVL